MAVPFKFPRRDKSDPHLLNFLFHLFNFFIVNSILVFDTLTILLRFLFLLSHITKLHKFLTELVECNICFETPTARTEIKQCINGHIFCNSCYDEYNELRSRDYISETSDTRHQPRCPVCRTTQIGIRSLIAEKLVEKLTEIVDSQESNNSQDLCLAQIS